MLNPCRYNCVHNLFFVISNWWQLLKTFFIGFPTSCEKTFIMINWTLKVQNAQLDGQRSYFCSFFFFNFGTLSLDSPKWIGHRIRAILRVPLSFVTKICRVTLIQIFLLVFRAMIFFHLFSSLDHLDISFENVWVGRGLQITLTRHWSSTNPTSHMTHCTMC